MGVLVCLIPQKLQNDVAFITVAFRYLQRAADSVFFNINGSNQ